MISVDFETAALASAVAKAARVAPTKGMAFDRVAGVLLRYRGGGRPNIEVRATNLEIDYVEYVSTMSDLAYLDAFDWRLPSGLLSGFLSGLPVGSGKTVRFEQDDPKGRIVIKSGKTIARVSPILGDYYEWDMFEAGDLQMVKGLGSAIARIAWATDPQTVPLSGIHFDGTYVYASDRYRVARMPLPLTLSEPVTVPLDVLGPVLTAVEDVRCAATERHLLLMPDDYTFVRCTIFAADYLPVAKLFGGPTYTHTLKIDRVALRTAVSRMTSLVGKGERYPLLRLELGSDQINLDMNVEQVGHMTDEIACEPAESDDPGTAEFEVAMSPPSLVGALDAIKDNTITLAYNVDNPRLPVRIDNADGYVALIAPRKSSDPAPVKEDDE